MHTHFDFQTENNGGFPLSHSIREKMESLFGVGFPDVRIHISSLPEQLAAAAFAIRSDIYFAAGHYDPATPRGLALLAHELTHVAQQRAGRTRDRCASATSILYDPHLEAEADFMARQAIERQPQRSLLAHYRCSPSTQTASAVVQMCKYCGDWTCVDGQKCKQGPNMGGLFPDTINPPQVSEHKETKQYSQKGVMESEHVVPHAALKKGNANYTYNSEPTISIPYEMHRGGQSGSGGGVTSTGSSYTAKGWSESLGKDISSGDWYTAIKKSVTDGVNSAWVSGHLTLDLVSGYIQVVNMHAELGRITILQAGEIAQMLINYYWNRTGTK